jgi:hypothetical protein
MYITFRPRRPFIGGITEDVGAIIGKFINLFDIYAIYVTVLIHLLFRVTFFGINYSLTALLYISDIFRELGKL